MLVWLRRDLRTRDNPALWHAMQHGRRLGEAVQAVYVHDSRGAGSWSMGGASRWYLDRSLRALQKDLAALGVPLHVEEGVASEALPRLAHHTNSRAVLWNRLVEPAQEALDQAVSTSLRRAGRDVYCYEDDCLIMPDKLRKDDGSVYRVYTPFWRKASAKLDQTDFADRLLGQPRPIQGPLSPDTQAITSLKLLDKHPWHSKLAQHWSPGEAGAERLWADFFEVDAQHYERARDMPGESATSSLSAALHFGEISVARLFSDTAMRLLTADNDAERQSLRRYLSELGWREFSRHVLHAWPDLPSRSLDRRFDDAEAWEPDPDGSRLKAWQRGSTGFSLVDAGMRELWETGWMHNRVRMVVASLLTKNLGIHWREGARWFWDTLVDADMPNNIMGWQWVAGCGTDAAPYYRIFNPETQAAKFDPHGEYRQKWLGQRAEPTPIIDLKASRQAALDRYQRAIKSKAA